MSDDVGKTHDSRGAGGRLTVGIQQFHQDATTGSRLLARAADRERLVLANSSVASSRECGVAICKRSEHCVSSVCVEAGERDVEAERRVPIERWDAEGDPISGYRINCGRRVVSV